MPITKSAIKKLRSDKKKALYNKSTKTKTKNAIDLVKATFSAENLAKAFSMVDKAAKKGVIKKGKADRIKSRLAGKASAK
jgi:small subunit ribosomal protein S20